MNSLVAIIWAVFYLAIPAGVIWLCRRSKAAAKAGAILILYFVGLIAGNLLIYPFPGMAETVFPVQDALSSITIPLALPLILFAKAANLIPLSLLGFIQYLSPTLALLTGVFLLGEPFTLAHAVCLGCIWCGLALVAIDGFRK